MVGVTFSIESNAPVNSVFRDPEPLNDSKQANLLDLDGPDRSDKLGTPRAIVRSSMIIVIGYGPNESGVLLEKHVTFVLLLVLGNPHGAARASIFVKVNFSNNAPLS